MSNPSQDLGTASLEKSSPATTATLPGTNEPVSKTIDVATPQVGPTSAETEDQQGSLGQLPASQAETKNITSDNTNKEPESNMEVESTSNAEGKPEGELKKENSEIAERSEQVEGNGSQSEIKQNSSQSGLSDENKRPLEDSNEELRDAKKPKLESAAEEITPLKKAQEAAEQARIHLLPELDPNELPAPGTGLPKHQRKYALSAIRGIKRLKDALPFVAPVDPEKQGVPHYFDYIKSPMDLGTIEKKLVDMSYDTVNALVYDFNLIVSNCIIFNGEEALISKMALSIAQSFKKQLSNMPTYDATRKASQAVAAAAATAAASAAQSDGSQAVGGDSSIAATPTTAQGETPILDDSTASNDDSKRGSSATTTVVGPNGVPTLRRKSTIDGRPKREVRPPRHGNSYVGSGTGEGRPRNKKFAAELRFASQVLREMQSRKFESCNWAFLAPVDPIAQGIPTYFDIIKEPMDLSTIHRKLADGIYYNADEFESDVRLMFRNCYTFNPEGTPVNLMGHKLESFFDSRWIEKPMPGIPNTEDSDASEVDEEYTESGMDNPAINVLEEQLRMIRKQLKRLKKDALADFYRRGHRKAGPTATNPKRRQSVAIGGSTNVSTSSRATPTEMTYEMKRELRDRIDKLPEKKIMTVIAIIQESMPDLGNNGQEEIELEVDALDTQTLLRLYNYAVLGRREPMSNRNGAASGTNGLGSHAGSPVYGADLDANTGKRRSKALSEEEHERKIAEIESKLKEFDHAAGSPGSAPLAAAGSATLQEAEASDSSDDERHYESDDSSSEEE